VRVAQERADRETDLVGILNADPKWRKGRLRDVVIGMKTTRHRNASMTWDTTTFIDAMALSVPYCDAVVTERHAYSILKDVGFDERMGTALMHRPGELVDWLAGLSG
jgi:hypothetical protein